MTKIIINKTEDAKSVIKKIKENEDNQITLVVPRDSAFGEQVSNFELLKEASTELDKEIVIESVDENVLALAEANSFSSLHPLFHGGKTHVSDILPAKSRKTSRGKKTKTEEKITREAPKKPAKASVPLHQIKITEEPAQMEVEAALEEAKVDIEEAEGIIHERGLAEAEGRTDREVAGKRRNNLFTAIVFIAVLGVIYFGGERLFGRAEIAIQLKKTPWQDSASLILSSVYTGVSASGVPAQIFTQTKTDTELFLASGKSNVSDKAKGKITVYNAYSSQPQTLVATTRFESPDGKIVRLVGQIIVPGAKIQDGKIIPSSILTDVIADKAGAEYNIGPLPKLSVPGFKNSPKFDGFYGALDMPLTGGFVGIRPTPTASDISSAKDKVTKTLKSIFGSGLFEAVPQGFKILDGATSMSISKLAVDTATDPQGKFSVMGEAKLTAIGFREEDIKSWLLLRAQKSDPSTSFRSVNPSYSAISPDFTRGTLKLIVASEGVLTPSFDADSFRNMVAGKSGDEARALILKIPELADGKLSLWPFWLTGIPSDPGRVKITVQ